MAIFTFLSDFGSGDYYVAAVKGVLLSLAPGTTLVDVTHEVAPGDVEEAAFLLAAALPAFPAGAIHLAVVDPGVGSARRMLALETVLPGHAAPSYLIGPDNGLFEPFFPAASRILAIDRPDLYRAGPGATFHGRDRFAPAAAALIRGEDFASLGPEIADPQRLSFPRPQPFAEAGREGWRGRVAHVDRYGNLISDLPATLLPFAPPTRRIKVEIAGREITAGVRFYAEIPPGEAAWMVGSTGKLELSLTSASLSSTWAVGRGETLFISWS